MFIHLCVFLNAWLYERRVKHRNICSLCVCVCVCVCTLVCLNQTWGLPVFEVNDSNHKIFSARMARTIEGMGEGTNKSTRRTCGKMTEGKREKG